VDPRKPSTVVLEPVRIGRDDATEHVQSAEAVAKPRGTDPERLRRALKGDLEQIVLMALRKEPHRRYQTVEALMQDLDNFERDKPIVARPVGAAEWAWRWCRRNPMMATTAALTVFLAVAGPLAALQIEHQRELLQVKNGENRNLLDRYKEQGRRDTEKIAELTRQIDRLHGHADPQDVLPRKSAEPRRQKLLENLLDHATAKILRQLQNADAADKDAARGFLAMAMLAEGTGRAADAVEYYRQARDRLVVLRQQNTQDAQISRAFADCSSALARLTVNSKPEEARNDLESARRIYEELAARDQSDPTSQIESFEAEFDSMEFGEPAAAPARLSRVAEIDQSLGALWPSDPAALYRLSCFLMRREPLLTPPADATPP
jgi:hypothetical protein